VSTQVTSQTKAFACFYGANVIPSGRFPCSRFSPGGSRMACKNADANARSTTSFREEWHLDLPAFLLRLKPWWPEASTCPPHQHLSDQQTNLPNRTATETHEESSSSRLPRVEIDITFSHAPDSLVVRDISLALWQPSSTSRLVGRWIADVFSPMAVAATSGCSGEPRSDCSSELGNLMDVW
jgi:hypothetical protein